jgi:hypothetical protein
MTVNRLFLLLVALFLVSRAEAVYDLWTASNTETTDSMKVLCTKRGILHGICSQWPVASSTMTVANSTYTLSNTKFIKFSGLSTSWTECIYYDVDFSSGIIYDKYLGGDVTILYKCY